MAVGDGPGMVGNLFHEPAGSGCGAADAYAFGSAEPARIYVGDTPHKVAVRVYA